MRIFLLASGSSPATIDDLTLEDAQDLYVTLQSGLWGPFGKARDEYNNICYLHLNKEVAVAVASGKKYKATPAPKFHDLYPTVEDFQSLGFGEGNRVRKAEEDMAKRAAMSLQIDGAPAWLKQAVSG